MQISEQIKNAILLHQSGQLKPAKEIYEAILSSEIVIFVF